MFWAYGSYVGGRLLVLVSTAVLARLLVPADFGLVALALIAIELLQTIRDLGVSQALIIVPDDEVDEQAETVFAFSVGLGAVLAAVGAALSPLAALFFQEPELTGLLAALAVSFFIRALGNTHYALAQKRMDFKARTVAEFADVLVRGVSSIAFAVAGLGAWSLVLGYILGALALTVTIWLLVPWRPRFAPQRAHLRSLIRFGGTLTGVDMIAAFSQNVDYIFIGRVLGATQLGIYTLAFRLPDLIIKNLTIVASQVLFPAFAAVERAALGAAFLTTIRYTTLLTLPLAGGLVLLAEPFVIGVFGDQWRAAVEPMQVLVIYALLPAMSTPAGIAWKAIGRADILLKLAVIRVAVLVGLVAIFVSEGIVAVAWCLAAVVMVFFVVSMAIAGRLFAVTVRQMWFAVWPGLVSAAAMSAALYPVERAIDSPWPALLAGTAVGAVVYLGALRLLAPESLRELRGRMAPGRSSDPGPPSL